MIRFCTVDGCDRPRHGRGLCNNHYQRWFHTGLPSGLRNSLLYRESLFRAKVVVDPSGCHLWTGSTDSFGYGSFSDGKRVVSTHRYSYRITKGTIPAGLCVLHACDNPPCCNPAHLWLGTKKDNAIDRERKGRGRHARERQRTAV